MPIVTMIFWKGDGLQEANMGWGNNCRKSDMYVEWVGEVVVNSREGENVRKKKLWERWKKVFTKKRKDWFIK